MKKILSISLILILFLLSEHIAYASSWSNYQTTTSSSSNASIPTSNQTEINNAEAEYNSASWLYKATSQDRTSQTYLAALAGAALYKNTYPQASDCLSHFLDATGSLYTDYNLYSMLTENTSYAQYSRLTNEVNGMMDAMEVFAGPSASLKIVEIIQNTSANSAEGNNWLYAIGKYRTWSYFNGSRIGSSTTYSGTLTYHLEDYYDWDPNAGGYLFSIACQSLWELNYVGMARNYHIKTSVNIPLSWNMGQRVGSGVTLSF